MTSKIRALRPAAPPAAVADKAVVLRRLELAVTRRIDGLLSGDHAAVGSGPGTEPVGARRYEPGDDARHIDWNLTARSIAPQVRTTEPDRELETWVVVDGSASLDFGTARYEKREVALAAVAAFGSFALRAGNRLGVVVTGGDELRRAPARSGRNALLSALSVVYDAPRAVSGPAPAAAMAAGLRRLERTCRRRSRIVVVSDFLGDDAWETALARLALRHEVVAVQVTDPRELELPPVGLLSVVDPETGALLDVQTESPALRARYAAAASERHRRIERTIRGAGAEHLWLSTDRDWLVDVARFLQQRRVLRRAR